MPLAFPDPNGPPIRVTKCGCQWRPRAEGGEELAQRCEWHEAFSQMTPEQKVAAGRGLHVRWKRECKEMNGLALCYPHEYTGAPVTHHPYCDLCELARSKGADLQVSDAKTPRARRMQALRAMRDKESWIDHKKAHAYHEHRRLANLSAFKNG